MGALENMRINELKIKNYRNLKDVELFFSPNINFLVGENDLGKSNFIDMLDTIFNSYKFYENDFNEDKPIEIELSLYLSDLEKGTFDDLFDPLESSTISIIAIQETSDDRIRYFHKETEVEINYKNLRCINYIKYDSLRNPKKEIKFYKGQGVGKFLSYLVGRFLDNNEGFSDDIIDNESLGEVVEYINEIFKKIKLFNEFKIDVSIETEIQDLIRNILTIKDFNGFEIENRGYGVQFSILIVLSILEKIMSISENKRHNCIFGQNNNHSISLLLGLDEPEIHLHPYMQRYLIKYITKLIKNEDSPFLVLIKQLFDIDSIDGQCIVVTHSPNIILNDYHDIIRFYHDGADLKIKSGQNINLEENQHKNLLNHLPYVKEAFFSRCNILVEGYSELGAFPEFADRIDDVADLDELGISIIQAGGAGSIIPLSNVLTHFGIQNVGIQDKKEFEFYKKKIQRNHLNIYSTNSKDFEQEIFDSFEIEDYIKYVEDVETRKNIKRMVIKNTKSIISDLGVIINPDVKLNEAIKKLDIETKKEIKFYLRFITYDNNYKVKSMNSLGGKTILKGKELAHYVTQIPESYEKVIREAVRLSKNV